MTPAPPVRTTAIVATLAFAGTVAAVMQTLMVPLIPDLPHILNTTTANATWVITVTLLVSAVFTPITGRLGDMFGKRRMLLACLVPLLAGSVMCALSASVMPMIIGRGLQGMGMGMIPLGVALLRDVVPKEKLPSSIALVSASMGIGGGVGLPIAAAVAQFASWRYLFWGSAVLAVVIGVLVLSLIPRVRQSPTAHQHFDYLGSLGLGAGLVSLLLAISMGATWGWSSGQTVGLFVAAVVILLAWGFWELEVSEPLVDLRTTARPRVLITNVASVLVGVGMYANSLIMPQLLQLPEATGYGLGKSLLATGLLLAPGGVMMMIVSPLGGKLTNARGPKFTLICGILVIASGYALAQVLIGHAWGIMVVVMVVSSGVGLAYGAMPALIMGSVALSETASANSFNTLMRALGTAVGATVIGVILAQMTTTVGGHAFPSESGFRTGLLFGTGAAVVAALVAAAIPALKQAPSGDALERSVSPIRHDAGDPSSNRTKDVS